MRKRILWGILLAAVICCPGVQAVPRNGSATEAAFSSEERPWIWWFWLGNVVTRESIGKHLESFSKSGIGGVTIVATYGVKGYEAREIAYRSPQWYDIVGYTIKKAGELGMGVDLALTSAWPFGGSQVSKQNGARNLKAHRTIRASGRVEAKVLDDTENEYVIAASGFGPGGQYVDLTPEVYGDILKTELPAGDWTIEVITGGFTGQRVKRSSPGGDGLVIDHFSRGAIDEFLADFDRDLLRMKGVRATFNDSYEVYGGDYTASLLAEFEKRRGYSAKPYLHLLFGNDGGELRERFLCDYRLTMADLILENFAGRWTEWSHRNGFITVEQAHGAPANTLDLYAAADIPQVESFGPSCFDIEYVRADPDAVRDRYKWPDKLFLKFGSSAAHVVGRKLVGAETATWLTNHFRTALSQVKPQTDELFIAGINHLHLISATNVPDDAPYPGWVFYPAPDFGPRSGFYTYLPDFSRYVARVQRELQNSRPDNDILLYYPVADYFSTVKSDCGVLSMMDHIPTKWENDFPMAVTARNLWDKGFSFDYISDKQIEKLTFDGSCLVTSGGVRYKAVAIPACRLIPVETLSKLAELAEAGANIVFDTRIPGDVPGLGHLSERLTQLNTLREEIRNYCSVVVSDDPCAALRTIGCMAELVKSQGLEFIRRRTADGYFYYLANQDSKFRRGWIKPGVDFETMVVTDPVNGTSGIPLVEVRGNEKYVFLELLPGQSLIVKTGVETAGISPWRYFTRKKGQAIEGEWSITFKNGEPDKPMPLRTEKLVSWTVLGDTIHQGYNGTGVYSILFDKPAALAGSDRARLLFSDLRDMAEVFINGKSVGRTWCVPYLVDFDTAILKPKNNKLEIRVTNLNTNRIIRLDRHRTGWQECYIADPKRRSFSPADWDIVDSGIIGEIRLIGCD